MNANFNYPPEFDFLPVSTPADDDAILSIGTPFFQILERMNGRKIENIKHADRDLVIFFVLSGGTEQKILKHLDDSRYPRDFPVILLAHSSSNSLPAALEILARLQQTGRRGRIIYLKSPEDTEGLAQLSTYLKLVSARFGMESVRLGLVGRPSDWLVASMPDISTIQNLWGPTVVEVDFNDYFKQVLDADSTRNLESLSSFISGATHISGPDQTDFKKSIDIYTGLQEVVAENKLDALSVRCFDLVTHHQATGCYALSQLNDDHVVAGCEGDLVSTIGMLWAKHLLGTQAWMANPVRIDKENNKLWLAHCTIALGMTKKYELLTHFETDLGIGIRGTVAPQPCTLFRIGGSRLDRMWVAEGQILQSGNSSNLCRTQLEIELQNLEAITQLLENPLGNHLILVFGHHRKLFESYHELLIQQE